jgi:hypothetical protein
MTRLRFRFASLTTGLMALTMAIAGMVFFSTASFDPDPHHDGVQFAAAAGVADGLHLFSQVFDQYGPVTAWTQGAALALFGNHLLVLRQLNAVLLVISAVLVLLIVRRVSGSVMLGFVTAIGWVAFCPDWSVYPGLFPLWPWPSVVLLVTSLTAVYLIIARARGNWRAFAPFGSGIACGAAVFSRWPSGVALIVIIGAFLAFRAYEGIDGWRRVGIWISGLTVSVGTATLYLVIVGTFREMVFQTITQPFSVYGSATGLDYWITNYGYGAIPALLIGLSGIVVVRKGRIDVRIVAGTIYALAFFALLVMCTPTAMPSSQFLLWSGPVGLAPAADIQALGPLYACILLAPVMAITLMGRGGTLALRPTLRSCRAIVAAVACASIIQLYPVADPYHLWWAAPLPLAFVISGITYWFRKAECRAALIGFIVLAPFVVIASFGLVRELQVPRVEVETGALAGMKVQAEFMPMIDEVNAVFAVIPKNAVVDFYCRDGLVAAWQGTYRAANASYVDWAWVRDEVGRPATGPHYIVYCTESPSSAPIASTQSGIAMVRSAQQHVHLSNYSGFYLYVYRQIG